MHGYDLTKERFDEVIPIIINEGVNLFVSATGVPLKHVIERLQNASILHMNMIGHPKHALKCLALGTDVIGSLAREGRGHTGDVPISLLVPAAAKLAGDKRSPMTGEDVMIVAAEAISNGNILAAALNLSANGIWVGTRFIKSEKANTSKVH